MTEGFPPEKSQEEKLSDFRAEIAQYRKDELDGKIKSGHLIDEGFSADQLTEEDMAIWEKIKDETITIEESRAYSVQLENTELPLSRQKFIAFVNNLATNVIGSRQMRELRERRKT